ncbi:hypothetical protein DPMN_044903 [Dreissena polymorpha]|uniref:Uncharacterized protein n=1 Tax=Dreissena polymorpha TaxID=45954 RepID=A0A9D4D3T6_DREPO|nr:hypothetical protein DPMN_044903 [Dreissena polymorpha]
MCDICGSSEHPGAMHVLSSREPWLVQQRPRKSPATQNGGKQQAQRQRTSVSNTCTDICGQEYGRSCAEIV